MIYTAHPKPNSLTIERSAERSTERSTLGRTQPPLRMDSGSQREEGKTPIPENSIEQVDLTDRLELANRILSRIESRLPCRIRQLSVYATDSVVTLTGQCRTFYTKQLAQHAAMGVLEYERLINNIDVRVPK